MLSPLKIEEFLKEGEGYFVEFKEAPSNLEKDFCAFANANGGTIYIGITDKGTVLPVTCSNRLKSQLQTTARNCDPPISITIRQVGKIIAVDVAESQNKPVRASDGFYLRTGATSQKLSRQEILSFAIQESRIVFDHQLYAKEKASDLLNTRSVELFRQKAQLEIELDNLQFLENIGCLQKQLKETYLTYGGILLFATNPQKIFPQATITLLLMENPQTILEQKILKGTLLQQVDGAFYFLKEHLSSRPKISTLERQDILEVPEFVLRELLVNAIVHRDYFETAADIVIKILPSEIEFSNPGRITPHLSLNAVWGKSFRRNPLLAELFFRANYMERAGTGLLRVKETLSQLKRPPLKLAEEGDFFVVTLPRITPLMIEPSLNQRQRELLKYPDTFFPFSTLDYAQKFNVSDRMARIDIRALVEKKILVSIKKDRHVLYDKVK